MYATFSSLTGLNSNQEPLFVKTNAIRISLKKWLTKWMVEGRTFPSFCSEKNGLKRTPLFQSPGCHHQYPRWQISPHHRCKHFHLVCSPLASRPETSNVWVSNVSLCRFNSSGPRCGGSNRCWQGPHCKNGAFTHGGYRLWDLPSKEFLHLFFWNYIYSIL